MAASVGTPGSADGALAGIGDPSPPIAAIAAFDPGGAYFEAVAQALDEAGFLVA